MVWVSVDLPDNLWTFGMSASSGFEPLFLQIHFLFHSLSLFFLGPLQCECWSAWCLINPLSYFHSFSFFFLTDALIGWFTLLSSSSLILYFTWSNLVMRPLLNFSLRLLYSSALWFLFGTLKIFLSLLKFPLYSCIALPTQVRIFITAILKFLSDQKYLSLISISLRKVSGYIYLVLLFVKYSHVSSFPWLFLGICTLDKTCRRWTILLSSCLPFKLWWLSKPPSFFIAASSKSGYAPNLSVSQRCRKCLNAHSGSPRNTNCLHLQLPDTG